MSFPRDVKTDARTETTTTGCIKRVLNHAALPAYGQFIGTGMRFTNQNNFIGKGLATVNPLMMDCLGMTGNHLLGDMIDVGAFHNPIAYFRAKGGDNALRGCLKGAIENGVGAGAAYGYAWIMRTGDFVFFQSTGPEDYANQFKNAWTAGAIGNVIFQTFRGATAHVLDKCWPKTEEDFKEAGSIRKILQGILNAQGYAGAAEGIRQILLKGCGYTFVESLYFNVPLGLMVNSVMTAIMHTAFAPQPFGPNLKQQRVLGHVVSDESLMNDVMAGMKDIEAGLPNETKMSACEDISVTSKGIGKTFASALPGEMVTITTGAALSLATSQLVCGATGMCATLLNPTIASDYFLSGFNMQLCVEGAAGLFRNGFKGAKKVTAAVRSGLSSCGAFFRARHYQNLPDQTQPGLSSPNDDSFESHFNNSTGRVTGNIL
jgi:hypothetical protein